MISPNDPQNQMSEGLKEFKLMAPFVLLGKEHAQALWELYIDHVTEPETEHKPFNPVAVAYLEKSGLSEMLAKEKIDTKYFGYCVEHVFITKLFN